MSGIYLTGLEDRPEDRVQISDSGTWFPKPGKECCQQKTLAWFKPEGSSARVFRRHTGPNCAGILVELHFGDWFAGRARLA